MADIWDSKKRSEVMSKIRGKGNTSTELAVLCFFKEHRISGWRRHLPLQAKPDFAFPKNKVAVFVDGCVWHGYPRNLLS